MATQSASDWLTSLRRNDELRYHLVEVLRQIALDAGPSVAEEIKYGGILFAGGKGFCGVFSYTNHVTLEFSDGASLPDPHHLLEGKGKGRRHLKLVSVGDIEVKRVRDYIALAYAYSNATRPGRLALLRGSSTD
ncbi:DUF1801 domain-containing protein [Rhizobium sp. PL01]|uniref:DUF1801 domain-containing protein n=1 Tax=Rhizobium sp. PL01 TaxID=3085631 RepID=UPI002980A3A0|nr:DUF1801 domain-containing protein [Rhizobium sp. PL01]MDW5318388.1 DUF1801 domain-containing protein [Rhizobium sp. PL01]